MQQFLLDVDPTVLDDLHLRLHRTRYARPSPSTDKDAGISPFYLRELVDYWAESFDWRSAEARINSYPQFTVDIEAVRLHFVWRRSADPDANTVLLLHGWPYSFVEMLALANALPDTNIVVPSLPGFGFSVLPDGYVATSRAMADTLHRLMTDVLGIDRFFVYGEDVGAPVAQWLAANRPEAVLGIHDTHAVFMPREAVNEGEEREFYAWFDNQWEGAKGYAGEGNARHDTISASLADSPAGLAAWMVEKFRDWSDCGGNVERRFSKDQLLTVITLYWITDTFVSSFRPYQSGIPSPVLPEIIIPATVAVQRHEHRYPQSFAERAYADLRRFSRMPRGGHFTAAEEPRRVADDIRWLMSNAT
jgi:epoxide hydrolase